jgi:hypothetical protein
MTCESHNPDRITNGSGEKIPEMQVGGRKVTIPKTNREVKFKSSEYNQLT